MWKTSGSNTGRFAYLREKIMKTRCCRKWITRSAALLLAAGITAGTLAGSSLTAHAAAAYDSKWTQTYTMEELLMPALAKNTDAKGVYEQLRQALRFKTIYPGNILDMWEKGAKIPADAARLLADDGLITSYVYKMISGQALEASDFSDVFDAAYYYGANPDLAAAGVPYDEQTLFLDFLENGMAAGRNASAEFNLSCYKKNYPSLVKAFGDNNANYYMHYMLFGKAMGQVADKLLKK